MATETHTIKCWPEYFDEIVKGQKSFELRRYDRNYKVGDTLRLRRWCPKLQEYSSVLPHKVIVTSILTAEDAPEGLADGFVIMSITNHPF